MSDFSTGVFLWCYLSSAVLGCAKKTEYKAFIMDSFSENPFLLSEYPLFTFNLFEYIKLMVDRSVP